MKNGDLRLPAGLAIVLCACVSGWPQSAGLSMWQGELHSETQTVYPGYFVELYDLQNHQRCGRAEVGLDGSFEYRNLPYGDYRVTLTNARGETVYQGYAAVNEQAQRYEIQVPGQDTAKPPSGGISVAQLRRPPSRKAFRLFLAAQKLSQAGEYGKAAQTLEKAVRISPDFAGAYTNLGVQHIRCGRYEQALGELSRAVEIGGANPVVLTDMAYAQFMLRRYGEALGTARRALAIDAGFAAAHYVAGTVLSMDRRTLPGSAAHLTLAAQSIPSARAQLARVQAALASATAGIQ